MLSFLRFLYQDFLVNNLPLGMCWIWENVAYSGLILCKIVFGTVPTVPNETIHIYIYIYITPSFKENTFAVPFVLFQGSSSRNFGTLFSPESRGYSCVDLIPMN